MKRTESSADACRECLEILVGGLEVDAARRAAAEEHLEACAGCQRDVDMGGPLDSLLGPGTDEGHPSSAELVAHAAGEGAAGRRQMISEHLESCADCRRLVAGAVDGLAEAEAVEAGLALLRAKEHALERGQRQGPDPAPIVHLPLELPLGGQPRALAADPALALDPGCPTERRVLLEAEPLRLVYLQVGAHGQLGLFGRGQAEATLSVRLDGEELSALEQEPEARIYDLGPVGRLPGRTLVVTLGRLKRSWTLVPEVEADT